MTKSQDTLCNLIRYGLRLCEKCNIETNTNWNELYELALKQGVAAIVLDSVNRCFENGLSLDIDYQTKLEWIGMVTQMEQRYQLHEKNIQELAAFYHKHRIRMMVLKGYGLSLNYPTPNHRQCGDVDVYLFGEQERADKLIHDELGIGVDKSHHHHTVFQFQGEMVENHYNFLNVHVRRSNKRIETKLKQLAKLNLDVNDNQNTDNIYPFC